MTTKLPELPEAALLLEQRANASSSEYVNYYTLDQLRAYGDEREAYGRATAQEVGDGALDFLETTTFELALDLGDGETVPLVDVVASSPPAKVLLMAGTHEQPIILQRADRPAVPDAWREAVIDGLIVAHSYQAKHDADPKQALHDLICWEVWVALDPRVSCEAEALVQQGRDEATRPAVPDGFVMVPVEAPEAMLLSIEYWVDQAICNLSNSEDAAECAWIDAIAAAQAAQSGWRPIESAPRDGTWIVLTGGKIDYGWYAEQPPSVIGQWTRELNGGEHDGRWQFAWYDGGYYGEYETPTRWMAAPRSDVG